jgi:beta-glucosidase
MLRNTSMQATTAVPQFYLVGPERAPARLAGWLSASLAPGERRRITIAADPRLIARHKRGRWSVAPGTYRLTLGLDADRAIASANVRIGGVQNPAR